MTQDNDDLDRTPSLPAEDPAAFWKSVVIPYGLYFWDPERITWPAVLAQAVEYGRVINQGDIGWGTEPCRFMVLPVNPREIYSTKPVEPEEPVRTDLARHNVNAIFECVDDLVTDFIRYDRRDATEYPLPGDIEELIAIGDITIDELVARFREALIEHLQEHIPASFPEIR